VNEVSCYGDENQPDFLGDFNDHWKVLILNKDDENPYLDAIRSKFLLVHGGTGCKLYSHDTKLPKWGIFALNNF
jgi:dolichyl-phosphate-mannose-protein mannosyltransferase